MAEVQAALAAGELVCIFPEGRLTDTGDILPFRPGIAEILAAQPVPVVPLALRGLWGSFFSRATGGKAMRAWLGLWAPIELVAGAPIAAASATPEHLQQAVTALRGDRR